MRALTATGRLVRLNLRRDRVLLPVWLGTLVGLLALAASTSIELYRDPAERAATAAFKADNAISRVFDGPTSGTELGALAFTEFAGIIAILVAIMSFQAVVRHTRTEEEAGRAELLGSAVVGHHARLAAALIVTLGTDLLLGLGAAIALIGLGLPAAGSVVAGAGFAGVGAAFAAVGAITAQVADSPRTANAMAGAVLGAAFLLRAVGDVSGQVAASGVEVVSAWPSWLSPLGWSQQLHPYHEDVVEVLGLFAGFVVLAVGVAVALEARRDVGAGLVPTRPGPVGAGRALRSPLGLAWRLQRGVIISWAVGLGLVAAAFGAVGESADDLLGSNDQFREAMATIAGGGSLLDSYFAFMTGLLGVAAAGATVQAVLRARSEETGGRLESVAAAAVGRVRWLASHVVVAAAGTVGVYVVAGAAGALGYGIATGDLARGVGGLGAAALAQAPAALALGGVVLVAVAIAPRWAAAVGWGALAVSLVIGQLGALLELPGAVLDLSPFTHVPRIPAEDMAVAPVVLLVAVGAVLTAVAFLAIRRRDLLVGG